MNASARIISASEANAGYFTPYQSSYCLESSLNNTKARGKVLVCQHAESSTESKPEKSTTWELCIIKVSMTGKTLINLYSSTCLCSYCLESSLNSTKARGKVLVCQHAESSTESKLEKSTVVKEAGGVGMIFVDEADKDVAIPFVIPSAIVGKEIGNKILTYINHTRFSQPAPRVAAFSSKGPSALTPEILKPDVSAPGLNILAAWSTADWKNAIQHSFWNFHGLSPYNRNCNLDQSFSFIHHGPHLL